MPLNLAKLVSNRQQVAVDFGNGDVLNVEVYPAKITTEMLTTIAALQNFENLPEERAVAVFNSAADILCTLLASWDFVEGPEGDEKLIPIDHEHLSQFGATIQWTILNSILSAQTGEVKAPGTTANAAASGAIS